MNAEQAQKRRVQGGVQHSTPVMEALKAREKALDLPLKNRKATKRAALRFLARNGMISSEVLRKGDG